jgi:predicted dehydrogenase
MGNVHARHLSRLTGVELYYFEPDAARAAEFGSKYKVAQCDSLASLLGKVDVVDVCVPTDLHIPIALDAVNAGKAAFVEKPVARTVADALPLLEASRKAKVPVGVGQVVRYFPEFRNARKMVVDGKIGTPAAARTRRGGLMPGKGANWFADHNRSGGVLIDLAIHDFDWLRWTLGEVTSLYSRSVGAATMAGPDYALTTLTFDNGAVGHVESTWMDPAGFRTTFEVCGSGGMIEFDSRLSASLRTTAGGISAAESPLSASDDPYFNELSDFVSAVENGKEPPVSLYDGMMALSIAEAALESAQTGKPVNPTRDF